MRMIKLDSRVCFIFNSTTVAHFTGATILSHTIKSIPASSINRQASVSFLNTYIQPLIYYSSNINKLLHF